VGLGGHILWTAALRAMTEEAGKAALVTHMPAFTDLARGRLYKGDVSLADSPVFRNNPRLVFSQARTRGTLARHMDRLFSAFLERFGLMAAYERTIFRLAARHSRDQSHVLVNLDNRLHSYAGEVLADRMVWKTGGHAVDIMLKPFGVSASDTAGELHFTEEERDAARRRLRDRGLEPGRYVALDADTKTEYFGNLRAWPLDRWQSVVDHLRARFPEVPLVQVGLESAPRLRAVVDMCGETTFREAALVIADATLFMGTESGLMHAARAVDTAALILWGGISLPELAAHRDRHRIICKYVDCAPCGRLGQCPNGHKCMQDITVEEVASAAESLIEGSMG
jgi:hypothetical protein